MLDVPWREFADQPSLRDWRILRDVSGAEAAGLLSVVPSGLGLAACLHVWRACWSLIRAAFRRKKELTAKFGVEGDGEGLGGAVAFEEVAAGDEGGAHLEGDAGGHLDVEKGEAAGAEVLEEMVEGSFGSVADAVEHGFAGEVAAEGDAVNAADEKAVLPDFE